MAELSEHAAKVSALLVLGDVLVSLDAHKHVCVWAYRTRSLVRTLIAGALTPTTLLHPDTYVNKVLVGTREGLLQLWNINTGQVRLPRSSS